MFSRDYPRLYLFISNTYNELSYSQGDWKDGMLDAVAEPFPIFHDDMHLICIF